MRSRRRFAAVLGLAMALPLVTPASGSYLQVELVSNVPGRAPVRDPFLVNPWGLASSGSGPLWVANNGRGVSTVYDGTGAIQSPVVTIPAAAGSPAGTVSAPTGVVFNGSSTSFLLNPLDPTTHALFVFATQDGTISGWNPAVNPSDAVRMVNNGATYTGLAIDAVTNRLYAADFAGGRIDTFDAAFQPALPGTVFTDPNLPAGYSPFNIQNLAGSLFVTYALVNPAQAGEEVAGPGLGIVDAFDTDGNLIRRVTTAGALNAPWGLALAPADFGEFGNALLVGNLGDGRINAFDAGTGAFLGPLANASGTPIENDGLWGLRFGNDGAGGRHDQLFFVAGIDDESNGLLGRLSPVSGVAGVPEPPTLALLWLGALLLGGARQLPRMARGRSRRATR